MRIISVAPKDLSRSVGEDHATILNSANKNRNLYTCFKEQLVTEGVIKWCLHEPGRDIVVMTDYSAENGYITPSSFVHVTCTKDRNAIEPILKCTCSIYRMIQRAQHQDIEIWPHEDGVLDNQFTCMHCRFYIENLVGCIEKMSQPEPSLSNPLKMVMASLNTMGDPVMLLGNVLFQGTTKFSVHGKGTDNYAVVHISFHQGSCMAKCTDGMCLAELAKKNKKKIPKVLTQRNWDNLCPHMHTLFVHIELVHQYFPQFFNALDNDVIEGMAPIEQVNLDDQNLDRENMKGNFNIDTGLWEFKAISTHKPREMFDEQLIR
jgi:hypothetical protein